MKTNERGTKKTQNAGEGERRTRLMEKEGQGYGERGIKKKWTRTMEEKRGRRRERYKGGGKGTRSRVKKEPNGSDKTESEWKKRYASERKNKPQIKIDNERTEKIKN